MKYKIISVLILFLFLLFPFIKKEENCYKNIFSKVEGNSMYPYFSNWDKIEVLQDFYKCNTIKRNDFVIFNSSYWQLIKQVKALPWDKVEFLDKNIYINWKKIFSNEWNFDFNQSNIDLIWLYLENGYLKKDLYLVFWTRKNWIIDSRILWPINFENIVWKVKK